MTKKKLVIFDFDGVIVNTHEVSFALNQATNPHLTEELYSQMSHGNFYSSYESDTPILTFTPNPQFREEYRRGILELVIPEVLKKTIINLSKKYHLAICSSAFDQTICDFLEKEELLDFFPDVFGVNVDKSKVVKLKMLVEKYNLEKEDAVFITDTLGDIVEANEAGVKSIGETWGLHNRELLEKGNPEIIIDEMEALEEVVERVLNS
jgi:phosphoglycolate phosphatase